jgi:hypothetical protein
MKVLSVRPIQGLSISHFTKETDVFHPRAVDHQVSDGEARSVVNSGEIVVCIADRHPAIIASTAIGKPRGRLGCVNISSL